MNPLLIIAVVLHGLAIFFFLRRKHIFSLAVLMVGGALLRYYMITLDHFLNEWDERFHAVVAKNMMGHMLRPTLFENPVLPFDHTSWFGNHIWLHKQPLFLWQMALSMRLFGVNEVAIRIPDLVLGTLLIAVLYDMGRLLFSRDVGIIAALIFSCYGPLLELTSGFGNTDHNDVVFCCYVTMSIYAWLLSEKRQSAWLIVLMGLLCGMAVLTKWLTGVVAFAGFGIYHLLLQKDLITRRILTHMALGAVICAAVAVPWQLYILQHYPVEARFEYLYNSRHFYEVVEGKYAPWWFHLGLLQNHYKGLQWLMFAGFAIVVMRLQTYRLAACLVCISVLVYVFFSIAATKMFSFTLMIAPVNILFIAFAMDRILGQLRSFHKAYMPVAALLLIALLMVIFDYNRVYTVHIAKDNWADKYRAHALADRAIFDKIKRTTTPSTVLVGYNDLDNISSMFYTDRVSYDGINKEALDSLQVRGLPVVFMTDTLPAFAVSSGAKTIGQL